MRYCQVMIGDRLLFELIQNITRKKDVRNKKEKPIKLD